MQSVFTAGVFSLSLRSSVNLVSCLFVTAKQLTVAKQITHTHCPFCREETGRWRGMERLCEEDKFGTSMVIFELARRGSATFIPVLQRERLICVLLGSCILGASLAVVALCFYRMFA